MSDFLLILLFLCVGGSALVILPVMQHRTLPHGRKILLSVCLFVFFVPIALFLYAWIGVPQLGVL